MTPGPNTVIYPVMDVDAAKAIFTALLGTEPAYDTPYYIGYVVDGRDIGLDPNGHAKGMTGPVGYWHVGDIAATIAQLVEAGATVTQEPTNVGNGRQIATLADPDNNPIGLIQDQA